LHTEELHEFVLLTEYNLHDQLEDEMGGTCGTCCRRGEVHIGFWWGNLEERGHVEDLGIDGG